MASIQVITKWSIYRGGPITEVVRIGALTVYVRLDCFVFQGKEDYLAIIHNRLEVHGTVFTEPGNTKSIIPQYVHNHGILSGPDLHRLLRQSKVGQIIMQTCHPGDCCFIIMLTVCC